MAAAAEDRLLTKILGVTLQIQTHAQDGVVYLADLTQVSKDADKENVIFDCAEIAPMHSKNRKL